MPGTSLNLPFLLRKARPRVMPKRIVGRAFFGATLFLASVAVTGDAQALFEILPAAAAHRHAPIAIRERLTDSNLTSTNWSGYAVTGAPGSITRVKGSWTVPAVQGPCTAQFQASSFWVGIDGFMSNTVEQIGTD